MHLHSRSSDHMEDIGHYVGFFTRVIAAMIDVTIVRLLGRWIGRMIFGPTDIRLALVSTIIAWLYFSLLESSSQQGTIGKIFLRIKVTDLKGNRIGFFKATIRHFMKIVSAIVLGIGFLMVIWTDRHQALHDLVAKTVVIRK
jgi:uncharacterized RDD family membrane protein YckC